MKPFVWSYVEAFRAGDVWMSVRRARFTRRAELRTAEAIVELASRDAHDLVDRAEGK